MHKYLFIYGISLSLLIACKPPAIDEEQKKLTILEQKINAQFDSLQLVSATQLLNIEDSIQELSTLFNANIQDSINIVFSKQLLRNFKHQSIRLASFRNYRDSLQQELTFSKQQAKHLREDLENRVWDKEQFYIFYVQETKSVHKSEKRIAENNKLIRKELNTYNVYKRKIRTAIDMQKLRLSSENKK